VVGTEWEAQKAEIARANFAQANLDSYIDLREGDIRQTLRTVAAPVDFLLLDIWTPLARPVIELIAPHMRAGAIVVADNTRNRRAEYAEFLDYLHDPRHGFATTTLPFSGGLEMSVKLGTGTT
jgi:predicted O-methyltransferase YrrM